MGQSDYAPGPFQYHDHGIEPSDAVMNHDHDSVPAQATQQNPSHDGSKHALHGARKTIQHIRRQKGAMQELSGTP